MSEFISSNRDCVEKRGDQWYTVTYNGKNEISRKHLTGDEKTTIWRVQNKYGFGPYNQNCKGNILLTLMDAENGKYVKKPHPEEDPVLRTIFNDKSSVIYNYGFKSIEQYKQWFESASIKQTLHDKGFFLVQYEVDLKKDKVLIGEQQVVFTRSHPVITTFRQCHEPDIDMSEEAAQKNPHIKKFLDDQGISSRKSSQTTPAGFSKLRQSRPVAALRIPL